MGSIRTWSLAAVAAIFVIIVAHQRSERRLKGTAQPVAQTRRAAVAALSSRFARWACNRAAGFFGPGRRGGRCGRDVSVTESRRKSSDPRRTNGQGDGDDPLSQFFRRFQAPTPERAPPSKVWVRDSSSARTATFLTNAHVVSDASEFT